MAANVSTLCTQLFPHWATCAMLRIQGCLTKIGGEKLPPLAAEMEEVGSGSRMEDGGVGGSGRRSEKRKKGEKLWSQHKMNFCSICNQSFSRRDVMLRHMRNIHVGVKDTKVLELSNASSDITFNHPFSMVLSGPSGSGKTKLTSDLLQTSIITPSPQHTIWCYGQC